MSNYRGNNNGGYNNNNNNYTNRASDGHLDHRNYNRSGGDHHRNGYNHNYNYRGGGGGGDGGYHHNNNYRQNNFKPSPDLEELFEKRFDFDLSQCRLPHVDHLFAETAEFQMDPRMAEAKAELNRTKSKLDDKDISIWGKHTGWTSKTADVVRRIRSSADPEMCTIAWAKMYEMLATYELVPKIAVEARALNSVHLCEAPGAFICSTNHFLKTRYAGMQWDWFAVSLNPYYEGNDNGAMIDDDRFIVETINKWHFGEDNTGNIMTVLNVRSIWKRAKTSMQNPEDLVLLVTSDGSVDCQSSDPNEQEEITSSLHYCEAVCALGLLAKGGSFVLKMFTLFEHSTIGLLYLLGCAFEKLSVCKPATSKSGNSETYVVCTGFRGIPHEHLEKLVSRIGENVFRVDQTDKDSKHLPLIARNLIDDRFFDQCVKCARKFADYQRETIEDNLRLFDIANDWDVKNRVRSSKEWVAREWLNRFHVKRIPWTDRIAPSGLLDGSRTNVGKAFNVNAGRDKDGGTLAERQEKRSKKRGLDAAETQEDDDGHNNNNNKNKNNSREDAERRTKGARIEGEFTGTMSSSFSANNDNPSGISSVAMKMMASMGYKEGQGLGAQKQGMTNPLEVELKNNKQGIGFNINVEDDDDLFGDLNEPAEFNDMSNDGIWLTKPRDKSLASAATQPSEPVDFAQWKMETGARIKSVIHTKFLDKDTLFKLREKRNQLVTSGLRDATTFKKACSALLCPHHVSKGGLGGLSEAALKLAALDTRSLGVVPAALGSGADDTSTMYFADLSPEGSSAEYVLWKHRHRQQHKHVQGWTTAFAAEEGSGSSVSFQAAEYPNNNAKTEDKKKKKKSRSAQLSTVADRESFAKFVLSQTNGQGLSLVVGDLSGKSARDSSSELAASHRTLQEIITALSVLKAGGNLVVKISDCLTRFSAGVVYVLYSLFDRICIRKPFVSCSSKSERFVVCHGFAGRSSNVISYLNEVDKRIQELNGTEFSVVEIVPSTVFAGTRFWQYVVKRNGHIAKREIEALEKLLASHNNNNSNSCEEEVFSRQKEQLRELIMAKLGLDSAKL